MGKQPSFYGISVRHSIWPHTNNKHPKRIMIHIFTNKKGINVRTLRLLMMCPYQRSWQGFWIF